MGVDFQSLPMSMIYTQVGLRMLIFREHFSSRTAINWLLKT